MKIAYIGEYHSTNGTYYRQRVTVNREEFDQINKLLFEKYSKTQNTVLKNHIMTGEQLETLYYQKPLNSTEHYENKYYLKLNQVFFIMSNFPNKRWTVNNTILIVK